MYDTCYYKYFRDDIYLDKSIRYNELFFAHNNLLNDPSDLRNELKFFDSAAEWEVFFKTHKVSPTIFLSDYLTLDNNKPLFDDLIKEVNASTLSDALKNRVVLEKKLRFVLTKNNISEGDDLNTAIKIILDKFDDIQSECYLSASFSETPLNYLMWSHYANGFRGCVLIYTFKNEVVHLKKQPHSKELHAARFKKINYKKNKKLRNLSECVGVNSNNFDIFFEKHSVWQYEQEIRLALKKNGRTNGEVFYLPDNAIKGVIFGVRSSESFINSVIESVYNGGFEERSDSFFSFYSEINEDGQVSLSRGQNHKKSKTWITNDLSNDEIKKWNEILTK